MSRGAVNFDEDKVEYYTPRKILDFLRLYGYEFDYDPATTQERAVYHHIPNFDTAQTDGLRADWTQYRIIWVNPPFSRKKEFWQKAVETYQQVHNHIFFLCPANFLPTKMFVSLRQPISLLIPEGRIAFEITPEGGGATKAPAFGSVIVKPSENPTIRYIPQEWLK